MSPFIPHLILRDIFLYLSSEDSSIALSALHSCMLVNHHWCSNAVPIYWSKPFRHTSASLINTFLHSLSSSERDAITRVHDISLPTTKPYHNYPLYLRDFDYWAFMKSIKAYIAKATMTTTKGNESNTLNGARGRRRETHKSDYENLRHVMSTEIMKMFIRVGVKLYHLRVLTWEDQLDSNEYLLLLQPELHSLLTPVRELEIAACYQKSVFLSSLAKICRNILSMHLTLANWGSPEDNGKAEMLGLSELIKAQNSLTRIQFWTFRHYGANIGYVLEAIQTQAEFLTDIHFHDVNFTATKPLNNIAACYNLERLTLKGCDLNGSAVSPLLYARFPRLGRVEVCSCHNNELKAWAAWMNSPLKLWRRGESFIDTSWQLQMCTT